MRSGVVFTSKLIGRTEMPSRAKVTQLEIVSQPSEGRPDVSEIK